MTERVASWSRGCLTMQGYGELSDGERRSLWLGLRFSPALCFAGIALGTALASPALLLAMAATALVGGNGHHHQLVPPLAHLRVAAPRAGRRGGELIRR
jgi:hypothetical protein